MGNKPILILQMQRMGDLILSYPLMLWLEREYPGHPIYVCAEQLFYEPLMKLSPAVTYFPWTGAGELKKRQYALVINLSLQAKAAQLAHRLKAERKVGPVEDGDGVRLVHGHWQLLRTSLVKNNLYNRFHWAELNGLDVISPDLIKSTRFPQPRTLTSGTPKVGLFLGASEKAKRPRPQLFVRLIRELLGRGMRPVLFGGPAETDLGRRVETLAKAPVLNLAGKLGLEELSAIGQTLSLFITPDTGPMHLAAWTGLKCLNLSMGNVNPWETGPYTPGHYVLRADMDCAKGCWRCTRSRLHCHDPFDPARIAGLAARLVAGDGPDKLSGMHPPGLGLFRTGRRGGVYHLRRLDNATPDAERTLGHFWQSHFGACFGLFGPKRPATAWETLINTHEETAETLLAHIPAMGRQFAHGLKTGVLLDETFWAESPTVVRPFTGYVHMALENGNYRPDAWKTALADLEALSAHCGK